MIKLLHKCKYWPDTKPIVFENFNFNQAETWNERKREKFKWKNHDDWNQWKLKCIISAKFSSNHTQFNHWS